MFRMELARHPAHDLSKLFWDGACIRACHLFKHNTVAIPLDELCWDIEVQQTCECFTWHGAGQHIAPDHYMVYFCLTNILEYGLQCGEVGMNIIDCGDPHDRPVFEHSTAGLAVRGGELHSARRRRRAGARKKRLGGSQTFSTSPGLKPHHSWSGYGTAEAVPSRLPTSTQPACLFRHGRFWSGYGTAEAVPSRLPTSTQPACLFRRDRVAS